MTATEQVQQLDVDAIKPSKTNRNTGSIDELVASVKAQGVLVPVLVRPNGSGFQLVYGERRWLAAKAAGLETVPAIVREIDNEAALEQQLVENLQRKDIDALEEAEGYKRLRDVHSMTQAEIATRVGRSEALVSKRLSLLELPAVALKALSAGKLATEAAYELRKLKDHPDEIEAICKTSVTQGLDAEDVSFEVEQAVRRIEREAVVRKAADRAKSEGIKIVSPPSYSSKVRFLGRGGGSYEIPFTKAQHKKEPCHAATLKPGHPAATFAYVCTDPARHAPKGASSLKLPADAKPYPPVNTPKPGLTAAEKKKLERERARADALRDARLRRQAFIRELVTNLRGKKVSKDEILNQIAKAVVGVDGDDLWAVRADAAEILGLMTPAQVEDHPDAADEAVQAYAAKSSSNLHRAALCAALCVGEPGPHAHDYSSRLWHFEFLVRRGYELSDVELDVLKEQGVTFGKSDK